MRLRLVYVLKTDIYPPDIVREDIAACVKTATLLKTALNAVIAWRLPQLCVIPVSHLKIKENEHAAWYKNSCMLRFM